MDKPEQQVKSEQALISAYQAVTKHAGEGSLSPFELGILKVTVSVGEALCHAIFGLTEEVQAIRRRYDHNSGVENVE
jgi:hypothetical protein